MKKKGGIAFYNKPWFGFLVIGVFFLFAGSVFVYYGMKDGESSMGILGNLSAVLLGIIFIGVAFYYKKEKIPRLRRKIKEEVKRKEKQIFWISWSLIIIITAISVFFSTLPAGLTKKNLAIAFAFFLFLSVFSYAFIKVFEKILPISFFVKRR